VNVGYGWSSFKPKVNPSFVALGLTEDLDQKPEGLIGGGLAGYNFQSGDWVYGFEVTANAASVKGSATNDFIVPAGVFANAGAPYTVAQVQRSKMVDLYTARLRLGYSFGNMLMYVTGGMAGAHVRTNFALSALGQTVLSSDRQFHTGYTVGAGAAYKITERLSARLDYSFVDLGNKTHQSVSHKKRANIVMLGLAYQFGN
jgi:opacity protein-like surface antigen